MLSKEDRAADAAIADHAAMRDAGDRDVWEKTEQVVEKHRAECEKLACVDLMID